MSGTSFLYIGSILITLWGIGHLVPTASIVKGFGDISPDNRRIITMEWIVEGLTMVFVGLLVLFLTIPGDAFHPVSLKVFRASALFLLSLAVLSSLTGARVPVLSMRLCPVIKGTSALFIFLGTTL